MTSGEKPEAQLESAPRDLKLPHHVIKVLNEQGLQVLDVLEVREVDNRVHMRLRVKCHLPDGGTHICETLAYTGAQVSLCRPGLLPFHLVEPPHSPMRLRVANGGVLRGGTTEVLLGMEFS